MILSSRVFPDTVRQGRCDMWAKVTALPALL
jgi:hypothetical protein